MVTTTKGIRIGSVRALRSRQHIGFVTNATSHERYGYWSRGSSPEVRVSSSEAARRRFQAAAKARKESLKKLIR